MRMKLSTKKELPSRVFYQSASASLPSACHYHDVTKRLVSQGHPLASADHQVLLLLIKTSYRKTQKQRGLPLCQILSEWIPEAG